MSVNDTIFSVMLLCSDMWALDIRHDGGLFNRFVVDIALLFILLLKPNY